MKEPDTHDYKKLVQLVSYSWKVMSLTLIFTADDINLIQCWVDGSFTVNNDISIHTAAVMCMGSGSVYSTYTLKRLDVI